MPEKNIIELFDNNLKHLLEKTTEDYNELKERIYIIEEFRTKFGSDISIDKLSNLTIEELFKYSNYFNLNIDIDILKVYKYIISEDAFIGTSRRTEPEKFLQELLRKIRKETISRIPNSKLEEDQELINYINYLLSLIKDNKIVGKIDNITRLFTIFEYSPLNSFSDEERKYIIKQFLISDLRSLKEENKQVEEEVLTSLEERVKKSSANVVIVEEPIIVKPKNREIVKEENLKRITDYKLLNDKLLRVYSPKNNTDNTSFINYAHSLFTDSITIDNIIEWLSYDIKDVIYTLSLCIDEYLKDINKILEEDQIEDPSAQELTNALIEDSLSKILILLNTINKERKLIQEGYTVEEDEPELSIDDKFKLIFVKNGPVSYFSKSLSKLNNNYNLTVLEEILTDLENGNFMGDRKIGDYKYRAKGSELALFYKVKNGHIFIFSICTLKDISSKKTDNHISKWSYTSELSSIQENGEGYGLLLEESELERTNLRELLGLDSSAPKF